jgi:hypothetical protein
VPYIQFLKRFLQSFSAPRAGDIVDWQQPKLNPSAFNMNRFSRICLAALEIRRTGENRPDPSTERVSNKHWERKALRRRWVLLLQYTNHSTSDRSDASAETWILSRKRTFKVAQKIASCAFIFNACPTLRRFSIRNSQFDTSVSQILIHHC